MDTPPMAVEGGMDRVLTLGCGRQLGYREFGDPAGYPVIALHGTPGSRFKYAGSHEAAAVRGLRLIALDRWGYGLSSPNERPTIGGYAEDVRALADALELETFHVTGVSGGGPFAVSVAAGLAGRVTAVALVSPVGLIVGDGERSRLSLFHGLCFHVLPRIPGALTVAFYAYRAALDVAPDTAMWIAVSRSPRADRVAMRNRCTRARLIKTFATGLAPSVRGPEADIGLFARPWGIDLGLVRAPVRIWIGTQDRNVPLSAAEALHRALPGSGYTLLPGEGHLWVAVHGDEVLDWLKAAPRRP